MKDSFIQILNKTDLTDYWIVCDLVKEIEQLELKPDTNELLLLKQIKIYLENRKEELTEHTNIEEASSSDIDNSEEGIRSKLDD